MVIAAIHTITDAHSRFLIGVSGRTDGPGPRAHCELRARVRMPERIRTTTGAIAGVGLLGLSKLSLEDEARIVTNASARTAPAERKHERMHRTLKEDTAKPPARTVTRSRRIDRSAWCQP